MTADTKKRIAAERALEFVEDGMVIGLGTGSTAEHFVNLLAEQVWQGLSVVGVATSIRTAELARERGISLKGIDEVLGINLTVDGADEVDPQLRLIKGGGGALLREKLIASASDRMIVIIDDSKLVDPLGQFPLPIEVVPFGFSVTTQKICEALAAEGCLGHRATLREGDRGVPFETDGGHYILDCACDTIPKPEALADRLCRIPGVVDHGLFVGIASQVIIGRTDGTEIIEAPEHFQD